MSKNKILTQKEINAHKIDNQLIESIESHRKLLKIKKSKYKVLDWGCGKGKSVVKLRNLKYSAYGIDIDQKVLNNAKKYFIKNNLKFEKILKAITKDNKTNFKDNYFHFIYSNQLFEHVNNLDTLIKEMDRILINNGKGFHSWAPSYSIIEHHLKMPLIHWLPKNKIRFYLILFYIKIGIHSNYNYKKYYSDYKKAKEYYLYSLNKTYYISYKKILKYFEKYNYKIKIITLSEKKRKINRIIIFFTKNKFIKKIINILYINFKSAKIEIYKI